MHTYTSTPWPVIDTPGSEATPWAGTYLMAEHRVKTTPADWANRWMWRTAVLISSLQDEAATATHEAAQ